jgi:hypothetical protein
VDFRSFVVDLTKGATKGPVPPTNIVAKDVIRPVYRDIKFVGLVILIDFGPHNE